MKKLSLLLAILGTAQAQDFVTPDYMHGNHYIEPYSPPCETRYQAIPTAYSTAMQHYYDSVWSEPKPSPTPIVIIIHSK
jgi:hypothetical protein